LVIGRLVIGRLVIGRGGAIGNSRHFEFWVREDN
jgi:hypothetical protein